MRLRLRISDKRWTVWWSALCVSLAMGTFVPKTFSQDASTVVSEKETSPELSAQTDAAVAFEFVFHDSSPELRQWVAQTLEPICVQWYPKLVAMLPSEGYTAPSTVRIVFQRGDGVAYTAGTTVTCLSPWFDGNLQGEAAGAVIHELVHVVQQYPQGRGRHRNPGWLVEGLTDYIRWFLYEPVLRKIPLNPDRIRYTDSYQVTATFLKYVLEQYDPELVRVLNAAMREGRYSGEFWRERTGRTIDELWAEFTDSLREPKDRRETKSESTAERDVAETLERMAIRYLKLALEIGAHDPDYVDAYYGPALWREEANAANRSLATLQQDVETLLAQLQWVGMQLRQTMESMGTPDPTTLAELTELVQSSSPRSLPMLRLRQRFLETQCVAMRARLRILQNDPPTFDEEVRLVYDATAPVHTEDFFAAIHERLAAALPASESIDQDEDPNSLVSLGKRYRELASSVAIPEEKYDTVFRMAIDVARERTREQMPSLPADETFEVAYVHSAPWGAYAWYQGNFHTKIEVNLRPGLTIDSPVGLATHEGYPGHHVYYTLVEQELVRRCGWMEHSLMALYSPQAVLTEGAACLAAEMAFPGEEEMVFERDVLAPIVGLDPVNVEAWYRVRQASKDLRWLGIEHARRYLVAGPSSEEDRQRRERDVSQWTKSHTIRGGVGVAFLDQYRSYIACYALGEDLLNAEFQRVNAGPDQMARRWRWYERTLYTPLSPSLLSAP